VSVSTDDAARQIYDRLWADASERLVSGAISIDQHLAEREADRRRGVTLIARPGPTVRPQLAELIGELRAQEPEQHFYRPDELHVTIMTLVSASETFDLSGTPLADYEAILAELFARSCPLRINFRGVTASPGAVLVQGFVAGDRLNQLREEIRRELEHAGLGENLDTRYRIVTAHATIMRFRAPLRAPQQLAARLGAARERDFGSTLVERIDFVFNDWYMSHDRVRALATYQLRTKNKEQRTNSYEPRTENREP
jgi:2'-5' RNA ligase